jgi:tetratricopeptide (TPR) repeat protein
MTGTLTDQAIAFMNERAFDAALPLLRRAIETDPSHWGNWYMAGQCLRFIGDYEAAVLHLAEARALNTNEPSVLLALGIALELLDRWAEARDAFLTAIKINPDFALAYNSLALGQKKRGELEKAVHNYDAALKALVRRLITGMKNNQSSRIYAHDESGLHLWADHAVYAAMYLCSLDDKVKSMAFPSGDFAVREAATKSNGGLFWVDQLNEKEEIVRLFLPNYFNTLRELLIGDGTYAELTGNRSTVLGLLGRDEEAAEHLAEARGFSRRARSAMTTR